MVYAMKDAAAALRQLAAAKHVGKIVVAAPEVLPAPIQAPARWLISGGTGALGSLTARWLATQGGPQFKGLGMNVGMKSLGFRDFGRGLMRNPCFKQPSNC